MINFVKLCYLRACERCVLYASIYRNFILIITHLLRREGGQFLEVFICLGHTFWIHEPLTTKLGHLLVYN